MMIRNLKALGLALVAVFAMSAMAASAASAVEFHSSAASTTLTAGQTTQHKFTVNTGSVICSEASFTGSQSGTTAATVTVSPTYNGCEFEGLFGVTVNTNGCDYTFAAATETSGDVDIVGCGTNKYIQVGSLATCRVRVGEQSNVKTINYANESGKVLVTANVSGLSYEESGLFCAGSGGTNGKYTGSSLTEGNGGAASISVGAPAWRCAVVAEVGTGHYGNAACSQTGGGKEYVKVFKGGKDLGGGVVCAVVAEAGIGHYNDADCTETGGIKEYVKVIK